MDGMPPAEIEVEVVRDEHGYYWRPERDEARRSSYYATKAEATQAALRWQREERNRWLTG